MLGMTSAGGTEFFKCQLIRGPLPVFARRIIFSLALIACKANQFSHDSPPLVRLLNNFGNDAGADGLTAFADGELESLFHGDRRN